MTARIKRCSSIVLVLLLAVVGRAQRPDPPATFPPREVPARLLPVPPDVSPQLQKAIAAPPVSLLIHTPMTADAWREGVKKFDEPQAKLARGLWTMLGLQVTPTTIGGVKCFQLVPANVPPENKNRLLVHLHGGAYVLFAGEAGTGEAAMLAYVCKMPVISVDYRMPPDAPFPAAVDDAVAVWQAVIKDHDPAKTGLGGTSAGGGLTMATVLKLKELGVALPGALFIGTPASDCSDVSDSLYTNENVDNQLPRYEGLIAACLKLYAGDHDLKEPLISPIYGDLHGFPPSILITGTRDLLLSNTARAHRKLRQSGVEADLHVFEGMSHAQYLSAFPSPESQEALDEVARFFDRRLGR